MTDDWSLRELGRYAERLDRRQDEFERRLDTIPGFYITATEADRMEERIRRDIARNRADIDSMRAEHDSELKQSRQQVRGAAIVAMLSLLTSVIVLIVGQLLEGAA